MTVLYEQYIRFHTDCRTARYYSVGEALDTVRTNEHALRSTVVRTCKDTKPGATR